MEAVNRKYPIGDAANVSARDVETVHHYLLDYLVDQTDSTASRCC